MKKVLTIILGFLLIGSFCFLFTGCATVQYGTKYRSYLNTLPEPPANEGIICIIRPSAFGASLAGWDLFINGIFIGKLVSGSYIYQTVEPGKYTIIATFSISVLSEEVNLKAGEIIYLKTKVAMGFPQGIYPCSEEEAQEYIKKYPAVNISKDIQKENTETGF